MNYKDYREIMLDEGLEESEAVRDYLNRAIYWNNSIKSLKDNYDPDVIERLTKKFTEQKITFILLAIEIARFERDIGVKIFEEGESYIERVAEMRIER